MWFLLLWAIGLVTSFIHLYLLGFPHEPQVIYANILLHQFVVTFGLVGVVGIFSNIIFADKMSQSLGWPGGPFQIKYGFAQLALGVLGVMAIWFRGYFWAAVIVNMYMYGLSGLWSHSAEMIKNKKFDAANVSNIIMDFAYQAFITILSINIPGVWR
ncbi:MAG: hypothetical protein H0U70_11845 [Tatlockia sp.]|nr:hypothetical protein [Tatlockia sp.]